MVDLKKDTGKAQPEDGKFEIEDIKGPSGEELDIEEAVSEETPKDEPLEKEPVEEAAVESKPDEVDEDSENVLEEPVSAPVPPKGRQGKGDHPKWLWPLILTLGTLIVLGALGYGLKYYLDLRKKDEAMAVDEVTEPEVDDTVATEGGMSVFVNSEVGLNLRKEPDAKSELLAVIPYGTKIDVLSEQTGWVKTSYQNEEGWVSTAYTQETDPLIYQNETYGFGFTFNSKWAGYKFVEAKNQANTIVKTYYVVLPTSDKSWDETASGVPKGYGSIFVMGVYTKAEWAKIAGEEMKPAKMGESSKYVYTFLPAQASAKDLVSQYRELNTIIKTFETL